MKNIYILILLLLSASGIAQNAPKTQVVEVDGITGLIDKELPFDRSFYLKIKVKKEIEFIDVLITRDFKKMRGVQNLEKELKQFRKRRKQIEFEKLLRLKTTTEEIKDDKEYKYLSALCPPLPPNLKYEIILSRRYSSEETKELLKLMEVISNNVDPKFRKWIKYEKEFGLNPNYSKMEDELKTIYSKIQKSYDSTIVDFSENNTGVNRYLEFYQRIVNMEALDCSSLQGSKKTDCEEFNEVLMKSGTLKIAQQYLVFLKSICTLNDDKNTGTELSCPNFFPYNLSTYVAISDKYYSSLVSINQDYAAILENLIDKRCLNLTAKLIRDYQSEKGHSESFVNTIKTLSNLKILENDDLLQILKGKGKINGELTQELIEDSDFVALGNNTSENIKTFKTLIEDVKILSIIHPEQEIDLNAIVVESKKVISNLTEQSKAINKGVQKLKKLNSHIVDENIFGNTGFEKISSEASKWILPDAGLLFAFSKEANVLRPFLGVNINFGPVDKDVKSRFMPRGKENNIPNTNRTLRFLRQHTSLMLGVSVGSIKIEDSREDLFGSINIVTGLGFRVNRAIRLSGGTLWYNQINPNPLLSDKKTKALGFLSISFDIEFKNATQGNLGKVF
ncbi:hypothetical protein ABV409_08740 [Flagellimonas sp. DF-77]|uniref:hypothetical protein n=1 Tax=Flagellimonas algarum TaxID=3230298 RepID=UPI00339B83CA